VTRGKSASCISSGRRQGRFSARGIDLTVIESLGLPTGQNAPVSQILTPAAGLVVVATTMPHPKLITRLEASGVMSLRWSLLLSAAVLRST
jgi:hypothetical protein